MTGRGATREGSLRQALRASEARYRLLFESNPLPSWVYDTETLRFLEVNGAAVRHYGYSRAEFLAMTLRDIRPPDEVADLLERVHGPAPGLAASNAVRRHRRRDGTVIEVNVSSHGLDFGGRPARLVVAEDVTERRRTDQVQRATYRISEATQAASTLGDLFPAIHGIVSELMPARNFYIALHDPATETLSFPYFVDEHEGPPPPRRLGRGLTEYVLRTGQPFLHRDETYEALLARGEVQPIGPPSADWLGVPLRTPERTIGVLVAQSYDAGVRYTEGHRDILQFVSTQVAMAIERTRAEEELGRSQAELRQAQKMEAVGRLAGGIAHDFNNLLTAILSYSELLLAELAPDSPLREDVQEIEGAGRRAADLTQQLLAFSRRQVLQPRPVNLNTVVGEMDRMLRRLIGEDIELRVALDPALRPTLTDPNQLAQVLLNLAVNARDAMPDGGVLTIATANADVAEGPASADRPAGGRYATIVVRDSGVGMSRETQEKIFEPFFTTKPVGQGTGLGLSTVYGIVKQSGGYIFVTSDPGRGAAFTVYLPAIERPVAEGGGHASPAAVEGGAETVLLVEDDPAVRKLTREILTRHGYRVLEAADGAAALRICAEHPGPIDLMITDVVMPRMSGHELVGQARPGRAGLRVLYVSGYSDEAIARQGHLTAGDELLAKPYTPAVLTAKVREILERGR